MRAPDATTNPADYAFDVLDNEEQVKHMEHVCIERPERICLIQKKLGHCNGSCVDHERTGINGGIPV